MHIVVADILNTRFWESSHTTPELECHTFKSNHEE